MMISFLGWTLLHATWQGGLVAAALALTLWLSRRAKSSVRYVATMVALALTLIAPIATTLATHQPSIDASPTSGSIIADLAAVSQPAADTSARSRSPVVVVAGAVGAPVGPRFDRALPYIVVAWLVGVALLSIRMLSGVVRVRQLGRRGTSEVDSMVRVRADRIAERLGMRRAVRVLQSTEIDVPMVVGWLAPMVLVPVNLVASSAPGQIEMLLAHELAHIRRYDVIANLVQSVIETLLFYHPAIWWISARVREEREHSCDDLALATCGADARAYGAMLLELEESRAAARFALAATGGPLVRRVRRILTGRNGRVDLGASWFGGIVTMAMTLAIVTPASSTVVSSPPAVEAPRASTPAPLGPTTAIAPSVSRRKPAPLRGLPNQTGGVPDVRGHWVVVDDADRIRRDDKGVDSTVTILQTPKSITFVVDSGVTVGQFTFRIDASPDDRTLLLAGPIAVSFTSPNFSIKVDTAEAKSRFGATVEDGKLNFDFSVSTTSHNLRLETMRMTLEGRDRLVVQIDVPPAGDQPPKRTIQRLRRLPAKDALRPPLRDEQMRPTTHETEARPPILGGPDSAVRALLREWTQKPPTWGANGFQKRDGPWDSFPRRPPQADTTRGVIRP